MNRLAVNAGAVSLAQGFPDFACPPELKAAVAEAVDADINQYAITWGSKPLRDAIAAATPRHFPAWGDDRSRDADHGHLRRDRGDDRGDARPARPGRRDRGLRAVLRELRPRRDPRRCDAALRDPPRAGLVDRPGRAARARSGRGRGRSSSTRRTTPPARCSRRDELAADRGPLPSSSTSWRSPTTSTSTSCSTASTFRWRRSRGWPSGPCRSTRCRSRTR